MKNKIICGIQIHSEPCNIEKNTEKIVTWINKTVKKIKPDLIVFSETVTTGFSPLKPVNKFISLLKSELPAALKKISETAKRNKVTIVLPTYEPYNNYLVKNNAIVFSPEGKIAGRYSKMFPFQAETWTKPGKDMKVFSINGLKFGIVICYDGDFPMLSQKAALKDADIVIRPSALLRNYNIWYLVNRVRAYDNQIYFMGVNACGMDISGKLYFGHSMIVNPYASIVSEIGINEGFVYTEIVPKEKIKDHNIVRIDHIRDIKKMHLPKIFRI